MDRDLTVGISGSCSGCPGDFFGGALLDMQREDEAFAQLPHIRREARIPSRIEDARIGRSKYRHELRIETENHNYTLRYRKSRWHRMVDAQGCVRQRDLFGWIMFDGHRIGALEFVEFEPDPFIDNEIFFDTMDADYHADAHLAEVLCASWQDVVGDVCDYGSILEFRLAGWHRNMPRSVSGPARRKS